MVYAHPPGKGISKGRGLSMRRLNGGCLAIPRNKWCTKIVPTLLFYYLKSIWELWAFFIQMANKYLVFIVLCFCYTIGAAQPVASKADRIRFGVKGGVHFSSTHYSNLDQYDAGGISSGLGGFFAEFDLGAKRRFTLRPEILFLHRGSEVNGTDVYGEDFNYRLKAKYTDIRLPIIYNFSNPDKVSPYVYVAPVLSIARGGNIDYTTYMMDEPEPWPTVDASTANLSKFDFSAAAGIGLRIPVRINESKRLHLSLEANYQYGFTDTYGSKEKDGKAIALNRNVYNITGTRKNRGFEISASVSVPMSIFKKTKKKVVAPTYTPAPVLEKEPEPIVEKKAEEKPCYTLDEIMQLLEDGQPIVGKTICAIEQINFAFGKSDIDRESYGYLDKIVALMQQSNIRMEIKGHTDNVGSESFNLELSKKRAMAVYAYLVKKGVNADRLSYSYYGMGKPITSNDTEEGRKVNRRVEFEILN